MKTEILNANDTLQSCNGANQMFTNPMYKFNYTDGVRNFTIENGLYWFLDLIASHQNRICWIKDKSSFTKVVLNHDFQVWKLEREIERNKKGEIVLKKDSFMAICSDGNGIVLKTQHIIFSDFPFDVYTVWLQNKILLLPSEY